MRCDSQASLLARTFASPCFGYEPKDRVAIGELHKVSKFMVFQITFQIWVWEFMKLVDLQVSTTYKFVSFACNFFFVD
jgi:hypothetical protein